MKKEMLQAIREVVLHNARAKNPPEGEKTADPKVVTLIVSHGWGNRITGYPVEWKPLSDVPAVLEVDTTDGRTLVDPDAIVAVTVTEETPF